MHGNFNCISNVLYCKLHIQYTHVHLLYYCLHPSKICHNLNFKSKGLLKQTVGKCKQKENGSVNIYMLQIKIKITNHVKKDII